MRSLLFVPGHRPDLIEKAINSAADAVCLDLEDGVPEPKYPRALATVIDALHADERRELWVRPRDYDCFKMLTQGRATPDGIVQPKTKVYEACVWDAPKGLRLLFSIESPKALAMAGALTHASTGLIFGPADFAASMGLPPPMSSGYRHLDPYARTVAWAAKAAGKLAIAGPIFSAGGIPEYQDFADMGFDGAACLNPGQAERANVGFLVTPAVEVWARRVLEAAGPDYQGGVFRVRNQVYGPPMVRHAKAILAKKEKI